MVDPYADVARTDPELQLSLYGQRDDRPLTSALHLAGIRSEPHGVVLPNWA
jgi:hypothetical protein